LKRLYDPIRKTWVEETLEEKVRQDLIKKMIGSLGFPKSLIAVEKELDQLPHLKGKIGSAEKRRIDLLCFGKEIHPHYPLYPLLMVECKAHAQLSEATRQIIGYNYHVNAYFLCVANEETIQTFWFDEKTKDYIFVPYLLSYQQMIKGSASWKCLRN
jgi:hypothetical protein